MLDFTSISAIRKGAQMNLDKIMDRKFTITDEAAPACAECFDTGIKIVPTDLAPLLIKATGEPISLSGPGAFRCEVRHTNARSSYGDQDKGTQF